MPLRGRLVVDRHVRRGVAVAGAGVDLHGVGDARLGQGLAQAVSLLRREAGVLVGAGAPVFTIFAIYAAAILAASCLTLGIVLNR